MVGPERARQRQGGSFPLGAALSRFRRLGAARRPGLSAGPEEGDHESGHGGGEEGGDDLVLGAGRVVITGFLSDTDVA